MQLSDSKFKKTEEVLSHRTQLKCRPHWYRRFWDWDKKKTSDKSIDNTSVSSYQK